MRKIVPEFNSEYAEQWYQLRKPVYENLAQVGADLLTGMLRQSNVRYLSITQRVKSLESFAEKLTRKQYSEPEIEMTDLAGVRVISFAESDVAAACDVIRSSFTVHEDLSTNKLHEMEPDRFGYRSVHFVCDLGASRCSRPEYEQFEDLLFEIQVRTVLQHAWAEIEHDLGYKSVNAVPWATRRRFSRLAGLLEIADSEFDRIRAGTEEYAKSLSGDISDPERGILVDSVSLAHYVMNDVQLESIETEIGSKLQRELFYNEQTVASLAEKLIFVGMRSIAEVSAEINRTRDKLVQFTVTHLETKNYKRLLHGSALYYLCSFVLAERQQPDRLREYLDRFGIGMENVRDRLVDRIMASYKRLV